MFLRLGPSKREVPLAVLVPNRITTLAMCAGLLSLHFTLGQQWQKALAAIVISAVLDVLDGGAARLLRVQSKFGAVLDSLSDFVAFGVAPAMILHEWVLKPAAPSKLIDSLSLLAVMLFAVCAGLRLARFTAITLAPVMTPTPTPKRASMFFTGMPTPAAAAAALVPAFLMSSEHAQEIAKFPEWAVALYILCIGILRVSRVPMFALKGVRVSRGSAAPILVVLTVLVSLMVVEPWLTLSALALLYLATIPWALMMQRKAKPASTQSA